MINLIFLLYCTAAALVLPGQLHAAVCTKYWQAVVQGNDLSAVAGASDSDCCTACANKIGCKAYTYKDGTCQLKSSSSPVIFTSNTIMGIMIPSNLTNEARLGSCGSEYVKTSEPCKELIAFKPNDFCNGPYEGELHTGDFDGDGYCDLYCHAISGYEKSIIHGTKSRGSFDRSRDWSNSIAQPNLRGWCQNLNLASATTGGGQILVADVNGDKKSDLVCTHLHNTEASSWVGISSGKGPDYFTSVAGPQNYPSKPRNDLLTASDVNCDGYADFLLNGGTNAWYGSVTGELKPGLMPG